MRNGAAVAATHHSRLFSLVLCCVSRIGCKPALTGVSEFASRKPNQSKSTETSPRVASCEHELRIVVPNESSRWALTPPIHTRAHVCIHTLLYQTGMAAYLKKATYCLVVLPKPANNSAAPLALGLASGSAAATAGAAGSELSVGSGLVAEADAAEPTLPTRRLEECRVAALDVAVVSRARLDARRELRVGCWSRRCRRGLMMSSGSVDKLTIMRRVSPSTYRTRPEPATAPAPASPAPAAATAADLPPRALLRPPCFPLAGEPSTAKAAPTSISSVSSSAMDVASQRDDKAESLRCPPSGFPIENEQNTPSCNTISATATSPARLPSTPRKPKP